MESLLFRDIPDVWILYGVIIFSAFLFLWEEYLSMRQRRVFRSTNRVPDCMSDRLSHDTFEKARLYNLDKSLFESCHNLFGIILGSGFLLYGMMPVLWTLSAHTLTRFGYSGEIKQSMLFSLYSTLIGTVISLPWSVYSTFVLEARHGFNKQTAGFFVKDRIKSLLVSQCIGLPVVAAIVYIVRAGGPYFFLYLWLFCCLLMLFIMTIYPEFIAPIFDKFTPLPDGELRTNIEALATKLAFPLKKLYVVEGSKRSAHSNAYFYGFFNNKRIVLFDTLLINWDSDKDSQDKVSQNEESEDGGKDVGQEVRKKGCSDEEVVAVLSHELGHWSLNHNTKNIVVTQLNLLIVFAVFAFLYRFGALYRAFGFVDVNIGHAPSPVDSAPSTAGTAPLAEFPVLPGLMIILQHVLAPYFTLFGVLSVCVSRRFEFQADRFGKSLGYASMLKSALLTLTVDNLGFPVNDEWYSAWHHSHPPVLQRMAALDKTD